MKIIIKCEGEEKIMEIVFSNDNLSNLNYVTMFVNDEEYDVALSELCSVAEAFKRYQEEYE